MSDEAFTGILIMLADEVRPNDHVLGDILKMAATRIDELCKDVDRLKEEAESVREELLDFQELTYE